MGPHKASVFSQLEKMDLDADGHVDKKEMQTYFGLLKQVRGLVRVGLVMDGHGEGWRGMESGRRTAAWRRAVSDAASRHPRRRALLSVHRSRVVMPCCSDDDSGGVSKCDFRDERRCHRREGCLQVHPPQRRVQPFSLGT